MQRTFKSHKTLTFAFASIIFIVTSWFTLRKLSTGSATRPKPSQSTVRFVPSSERKAFWTTEQLQPRFAYVQYATDLDYLCNAAINFARLLQFAAKEDMILIHPIDWSTEGTKQNAALRKFHELHSTVQLRPFPVARTNKGDATWRASLNKFHAFDLLDYTRVLAFDSDSLVLSNMDHLFLAPVAALAVPRAYWINGAANGVSQHVLGLHIMLLEPNKHRYDKIMGEALSSGDFDMEVINHMFGDSAMILPHRRIALLTGEFRTSNHSRYLAPDVDQEWDAVAEVSQSLLVHFSDWPLPKPWKPHSQSQWNAVRPVCPNSDKGAAERPACADRVMWESFYEDYASGQKEYCRFEY